MCADSWREGWRRLSGFPEILVWCLIDTLSLFFSVLFGAHDISVHRCHGWTTRKRAEYVDKVIKKSWCWQSSGYGSAISWWAQVRMRKRRQHLLNSNGARHTRKLLRSMQSPWTLLLVSPLSVWVTRLVSLRLGLHATPAATVLKYESARPFFLPSLPPSFSLFSENPDLCPSPPYIYKGMATTPSLLRPFLPPTHFFFPTSVYFPCYAWCFFFSDSIYYTPPPNTI